MDKAKKVCCVSGVFQLAAGICFLLLPFFVRETPYYSTEYVRGWHMLSGYVTKSELPVVMGEIFGVSLLLLFLFSSVLVLICITAAVTAWIAGVPPVVSAVLSVVGAADGTALYLYVRGKAAQTDYHMGWMTLVAPCCLIVSVVIGAVSTGMRASSKKKTVVVPAVREKLPDIARKIEEKKYYQVVEQEPASEQTDPQFPPYTPGSAPRGVMVGLVGVYAGVEIPFQPGETIKVGRDAASNLIFDKRAPRVSRHHCEITWNPESQTYHIVDTSTNGTFKNGSEDCLPQNMNIALEVGCTISIGNEDNIFRLE